MRRVSQLGQNGRNRGVGDRNGIEFHRRERWGTDFSRGIGVDADHGKMSAKFLRTPKLSDVPYPVQMQPHLIVEFYSR